MSLGFSHLLNFNSPHRGELIENDFNSPLLRIIQDSLSSEELNFTCQFPKIFGIFPLVVVYNKMLPVIWECVVLLKKLLDHSALFTMYNHLLSFGLVLFCEDEQFWISVL